MEVAIASNHNQQSSAPFQRAVREWQHLDPNTGALLTGRLEADRWMDGPLNRYGKVVDSQNVTAPNGTKLSMRKQFEVLKAHTSSGSLQVVRAKTVQSSSSRWSSKTLSTPATPMITNGVHSSDNFETNHMNTVKRLITGDGTFIGSKQKMNSASSPHTTSNDGVSYCDRDSNEHEHNADQMIKTASPTITTTTSKTNLFSCNIPTDCVGDGNKNFLTANNSDHHLDTDERETLINNHCLTRNLSVSTEDLASERDSIIFDGDLESTDWRRVSKLRRSLQFPKIASTKINSRPLDLPENSVNVAKIRSEFENIRRLSTAMRNNHVDFNALEQILNGDLSTESKSGVKPKKKTTFITAESLKEVRGKLRRLSDESLYKDDILSQSDTSESRDIYINGNGSVSHDSESVSSLDEIIDDKIITTSASGSMINANKIGNPKVLENSSDWYLRRKSYGFEAMPSTYDTMSGMESSTDSGLGRSGELSAPWSPTGDGQPRGTIITFGVPDKKMGKGTTITLNGTTSNSVWLDTTGDIKRHSIAVDESKYVKENQQEPVRKTSIILNGIYDKSENLSSNSILDENQKSRKRVEFCKTEVHFAAESGRVNIVETDGKPPPTNNFRRRRRNSGSNITSSYLDTVNGGGGTGIHLTHFGDEQSPEPEQENPLNSAIHNVTVSTPFTPAIGEPDQRNDDDSNGSDEMNIRGILKNKPVKPRPYHLGENIESGESLWGVRLKPVPVPRSLQSLNQDIDETSTAFRRVSSKLAETNDVNSNEHTGYSTKISFNTSMAAINGERDASYKTTASSTTACYTGDNKILTMKLNENKLDLTSSVHKTASSSSLIKPIMSDELKSTTLIMRTLRSATQFDEAMKNLQLASHDLAHQTVDLPTKLDAVKVNMISSECDDKLFKTIQTSSSFGSSTTTSSFNYEESTEVNKYESLDEIEELTEKEVDVHEVKPIAAPRLKKLNSSNSVSVQLSQLRRIYEAAERSDVGDYSDDSARADEEVNQYLGYLEPDERTTDFSNSWSRLKAKRNIIKKSIADEIKIKKSFVQDITEGFENSVPKSSNVMSIKLHSPVRTHNSIQHAEIAVPKPMMAEIPTKNENHNNGSISSDDAKLRSGARQLKEHELSYFGVNKSANRNMNNSNSKLKMNVINNAMIVPTNRVTNGVAESVMKEEKSKLWSIVDNKPDLIKHSINSDPDKASPNYENVEYVQYSNGDGPIYENLPKPKVPYNRKLDLIRDETILSEMTKTANETMNSVHSKEESKRSKHTKTENGKPLDTIDEVRSSQRSNNSDRKSRSAQQPSISAMRPTKSSLLKRSSLSASSNESLSRNSTPQMLKKSSPRIVRPDALPQKIRSKPSSIDSRQENGKKTSDSERSRSEREKKYLKSNGKFYTKHRSSSKDTLARSNASSSDDLSRQAPEAPRRVRRLKIRDTEKSDKLVSSTKKESRTVEHRTEAKTTVSHSSTGEKKSSSSSRKSHRPVETITSTTTKKLAAVAEMPKVRVSKSGVVTTTSPVKQHRSREHQRSHSQQRNGTERHRSHSKRQDRK